MEKNKREQLVETLHHALELDRYTVGVKFFDTKEAFEQSTAKPLLHYIPYCVMVKSAAKGYRIKATVDNMGCMAAASALGLIDHEPSGEEFMQFEIFHDLDAASKVSDGISINRKKPVGVELSALEKMEEDPDVVIQVTIPYNAMRIIQGYSYHYGTYQQFKMAGLQAMCSESTVYPYISNDINVSMMCAGTRMLSAWKKEELSVAMPFGKFEKVVDGVIHTMNPLERDGDKKRIEKNVEQSDIEIPPIIYGKNYDTGYYRLGKYGTR